MWVDASSWKFWSNLPLGLNFAKSFFIWQLPKQGGEMTIGETEALQQKSTEKNLRTNIFCKAHGTRCKNQKSFILVDFGGCYDVRFLPKKMPIQHHGSLVLHKGKVFDSCHETIHLQGCQIDTAIQIHTVKSYVCTDLSRFQVSALHIVFYYVLLLQKNHSESASLWCNSITPSPTKTPPVSTLPHLHLQSSNTWHPLLMFAFHQLGHSSQNRGPRCFTILSSAAGEEKKNVPF